MTKKITKVMVDELEYTINVLRDLDDSLLYVLQSYLLEYEKTGKFSPHGLKSEIIFNLGWKAEEVYDAIMDAINSITDNPEMMEEKFKIMKWTAVPMAKLPDADDNDFNSCQGEGWDKTNPGINDKKRRYKNQNDKRHLLN